MTLPPLHHLRSLAQAAMAGPWVESASAAGEVAMYWQDGPDAEFIASVSPSVLLSLLDRVAELEAALVEACDLAVRMSNHGTVSSVCVWCDKYNAELAALRKLAEGTP
jgi:hypothetical protein